MSVGNRTLAWRTGEAMVIDSTFIRQDSGSLAVPLAQAALWASLDFGLIRGGAMNTWNYALNNLRAALRYSQDCNLRHLSVQVDVDPAVHTAISQVLEGIHGFLAMPALEQYAPIVQLAAQIFDALRPWLQQQPPVSLRLPSKPSLPIPADGRAPGLLAFRLSNGVEMPAIGEISAGSKAEPPIFGIEPAQDHRRNPDQVHGNTHVGTAAKGAPYKIISGKGLLQNNERVSTLQRRSSQMQGKSEAAQEPDEDNDADDDTSRKLGHPAKQKRGRLGLRHIDTAEAYQNEAEIGKKSLCLRGQAIRDSGIPREQIFLATKATSVALGMAEPAYLEAIVAGQLQALQTDYLDVYMLHAAGIAGQKLQEVWSSMERLVELGRVRALGVSNFGVQELEALWSLARIKPVYMQNIFKVYKLLGAWKV
ncbi:Prostaglandin F synthase [Symbiodinium microadriaticum]|uniref:Prostaglandin F synthase n=1 Tax=Symbiodinium microadriaticum TaxID=2951 RepID=A0A1Q9DAM7_SYMMI|nr:Prostaglandin F synthase [Symbiodinium microadriaticum]